MNIILLSGGSGKRLWPLSNDIRSKQFIKIFKREDGSYESMIQRMYRQIIKIDKNVTVTVAASKSQISSIHNQLSDKVNISVEPCRRDTFPAIVLAVEYLKDVMHVGKEEPIVVCPVDPFVNQDFFDTLQDLSDLAGKGIANPLATILSGGMMLRYSFGLDDEADLIEKAVVSVLEDGYRTGDIMSEGMKLVGTEEMTKAVLAKIQA